MVNAELTVRVDGVSIRRRAMPLAGIVALTLVASTGCSGGASNDAAPSSTALTTTAESQEKPDEAAKSAALDAFTDLLRVRDAAAQNPLAQDWEPEIRQHAADPAAYAAVESVRNYATLGLHQVGDSKIDLQVTDVDLDAAAGPTVAISGCYDSQASQVVRTDTGEPVAPGTPDRYLWSITVVQFRSESGQPWLVTDLDPNVEQPC